MTREHWLNGWRRHGSSAIVGTSVHCVGCGHHYGTACVDLSGGPLPEKSPEWPFEQRDCPVCGGDSKRPAMDRHLVALDKIRRLGSTDGGRIVSEAAKIADDALAGVYVPPVHLR